MISKSLIPFAGEGVARMRQGSGKEKQTLVIPAQAGIYCNKNNDTLAPDMRRGDDVFFFLCHPGA